MAKATRNTQPTGTMPLPYRLDLSERELGWLTRMVEISMEYSTSASQDEFEFESWVLGLPETFRQLDKVKG